MVMDDIDSLTYRIIGCAMEVYKQLGPGLLENIYEQALRHELQLNDIPVESQVEENVNYKGRNITDNLRLDLLVDNRVIVELKSVEELKPVHHKQLLTYLRLMDKKIGLLINFNTDNLMDGIKRVIN